jgi:hypothetical protein
MLAGGAFTKITIAHIRATFQMVVQNVIRVDPVFPTALQTIMYSVAIVEPAMPHLTPCYRILIRLIGCFPSADFINFSLVRRLLFLTQLPDPSERHLVSEVLKKYHMTHPEEHLQFIRTLKSTLSSFLENELIPLAGIPLITVVAHCIGANSRSHRDEVLSLVRTGVIPLLSHKSLNLFFNPYKSLVFQIVLPEFPDEAISLAVKLQNTWPVQCGPKEACFTELLLGIPPILKPNQLSICARQLFTFLAYLLRSVNFAVLMAVMSIFERPDWNSVLRAHGPIAIDRLYPRVSDLSKMGENYDVGAKSLKVMALMEKQSPSEVARLSKRPNASGESANPFDNQIMRKWSELIWVGAEKEDKQALLKEAGEMCQREWDPAAPRSHFMPGQQQQGFQEMFTPKAIDLPKAQTQVQLTAKRGLRGPHPLTMPKLLKPLC